jgi:hypothetical protein
MTPPLPLPVRVAAGLVVTAVEQARDLPRLALELPVTAVSQALQASMRVQQKVTELAIKGDRVLGGAPPVEDEPAWATFDDDVAPRRNGRGTDRSDEPATVTALRRPEQGRPEQGRPEQGHPDVSPEPASDLSVDLGPVDPGSVDPEPVPTGADAPIPAEASGPNVMPTYATLTIPQLRGKLRYLGADDLRALLAWEHAHGDRPPYVTMLSNRISTVSDG